MPTSLREPTLKSLRNSVLVALLIGGLCGVAVAGAAATRSTSTPLFFGCVGKGGSIDPNTLHMSVRPKCPAGERLAHWSQTGPAGARGSSGQKGPAGATGPQGATEGPCDALPGPDTNFNTCQNLSGVNWTQVPLTDASFVDADLSSITLTLVNATGADFNGSNLTSAIANSSTFTGDDFIYATMPGANFSHSSLTSAVMDSVDAAGANFTSANLTDAVVANVNFTSANFTNANLTGVDAANATFTSATFSNTTCPDGTNSNSDGDTCVGNL